MFYINCQGRAQSRALCTEAIPLWNWCLKCNTIITSVHLSGILNTTADALSRALPAEHEWQMNPHILVGIFCRWGHPTIDLFAMQSNSQNPLFCSRAGIGKGSMGDASLITWTSHLFYVFPPKPLLNRVVHKIRKNRACLILKAPAWPHQPSFPFPSPCPTNPLTLHQGSPSSAGVPRRPPEPPLTTPEDMAPGWFSSLELTCSQKVQSFHTVGHRVPARLTFRNGKDS